MHGPSMLSFEAEQHGSRLSFWLSLRAGQLVFLAAHGIDSRSDDWFRQKMASCPFAQGAGCLEMAWSIVTDSNEGLSFSMSHGLRIGAAACALALLQVTQFMRLKRTQFQSPSLNLNEAEVSSISRSFDSRHELQEALEAFAPSPTPPPRPHHYQTCRCRDDYITVAMMLPMHCTALLLLPILSLLYNCEPDT